MAEPNQLYTPAGRTGSEVQVEVAKGYRAYCLKDRVHKAAGEIVTVLDRVFQLNPGMGKLVEGTGSAQAKKAAKVAAKAEADETDKIPEGKPVK